MKSTTQSSPSGRRLLTVVKQPVDTAAFTNINLIAPPTSISGRTLLPEDRVLLTAQSNSAENGIYGFNGDELKPSIDWLNEEGQHVTVLAGSYAGNGYKFISGAWSIEKGAIDIITADGTVETSSADITPSIKTPTITNGKLNLPRTLDGQWFQDLSFPPVLAFDARYGVTYSGETEVDQINDLSGCGSHGTQTGTNRPTLSVNGWGDNDACLDFLAASSQYLQCNGVASKLALGQSRSVIALVRPAAAPAAAGTLFSHRNSATKFTTYGAFATGYGIINSGAIINTAYTPTNDVFVANQQTLVIFCHEDGAGNSHIYSDGRKKVIATDAMDATVAVANEAVIGAYLFTSTIVNHFNGSMRFLAVVNGKLTGDDYKQACRQLMGGPFTRIVCDGNSLTAVGWGIYPATLQSMLGARALGRYQVTNTGVGGQTIDAMIARYPTFVNVAWSEYQNNILVAWELSNQFVVNYSSNVSIAAQARNAVNKLWDYCALARASASSLGVRIPIIVVTATYREAAGYTGLPSKAVGDSGIDAMNAIVRAEWQSHADAIVDVCADPYFQNSALTYIFDDGTHMSDPASQVFAAKVARAVNRLTAAM